MLDDSAVMNDNRVVIDDIVDTRSSFLACKVAILTVNACTVDTRELTLILPRTTSPGALTTKLSTSSTYIRACSVVGCGLEVAHGETPQQQNRRPVGLYELDVLEASVS
jgi:hypothetical protein